MNKEQIKEHIQWLESMKSEMTNEGKVNTDFMIAYLTKLLEN